MVTINTGRGTIMAETEKYTKIFDTLSLMAVASYNNYRPVPHWALPKAHWQMQCSYSEQLYGSQGVILRAYTISVMLHIIIYHLCYTPYLTSKESFRLIIIKLFLVVTVPFSRVR